MESEINQTFESRYSLFSNQTSGHSCMIKVTNGSDHILKPLGASEQDFYDDAKSRNPPNFLNFIPKYYGVYYPAPAEISFFSELAKKLIVTTKPINYSNFSWNLRGEKKIRILKLWEKKTNNIILSFKNYIVKGLPRKVFLLNYQMEDQFFCWFIHSVHKNGGSD